SRAGQPVRIWSAGCSTGEELYSLAMALLGPDRSEARTLVGGDVIILASDLADHAVAAATLAVYPFDSLKDVPTVLIRAWTKLVGDDVHMRDEIRNMIRILQLNLLEEWPMKRQFDVIFCRNVMIYFDQPTKDMLVTRFIDTLLPGGYLYLGHSERVSGPSAHKMTLVGGTIYRKDQA
ncbi:MAG: protein-glutamate O-methyltransferase CheR, partial [Sphingobium sp.]